MSNGVSPTPSRERRSPEAWVPRSPQFSLRTLFVVISLFAVVAACFAWNVLAGILAYIGCLTLFMTVHRTRAVCRELDRAALAGGNPGSPYLVLLSAGGIALAAAIAFCCSCTVAQTPFITAVLGPESELARTRFNAGLWLSLPVGTIAALLVFWFSWPINRKTIS